jgi:Predicted divalent heavy-metal cations transporter
MWLVGVITASVFDLIVFMIIPAGPKVAPQSSSRAGTDVEGKAVVSVEEGETQRQKRMRVLTGVILGDFMHNFCDGILIGTGFTGCSDGLAWSITRATAIHEIAQARERSLEQRAVSRPTPPAARCAVRAAVHAL